MAEEQQQSEQGHEQQQSEQGYEQQQSEQGYEQQQSEQSLEQQTSEQQSAQADWSPFPTGSDDGSKITVTGGIQNGGAPADPMRNVSIHWTAGGRSGTAATSPATIPAGGRATFRFTVQPSSSVSEVNLKVFVGTTEQGMHARITF